MVKQKFCRSGWVVILVGLFLVCSLTEAVAARPVAVESPLTKLLANGYTADQVVALLEDAGLSGLKKNEVYNDPMAGLSGLEAFTDDQVTLLQASMAVKLLFLRVGSEEWGPGGQGDLPYLVEAVQMVKNCLSQTGYQKVYAQLNPTVTEFDPPLTIDYLISASQNLSEMLTLMARNGEIADPVVECEALSDSLSELVLHYYVLANRGNVAIEEAIGYDILPDISGSQYPQVDLGGLVTIYNLDGSVAIAASETNDSAAVSDPVVETITYPAAILDNAEVDGDSLVLSWSLPAGTSKVPSGGYDILIDGVDTGSTWRTTATSTVITGLEAGVTHTFQVQARWLQAEPDQVPLSNEVSATITIEEPVTSLPVSYPSAILDTVEVDGSDFVLNWSLPGGTSEVPSGGYDILIDGVDTGSTWRTTATSTVITGLEVGVTHTFQVQARWLQAEPDQVPLSNEVSANITVEEPVASLPDIYPSAILDSVEVDGSDFVLDWSLPAGTSEVPSGGYDIIIDDIDTGATWRTTATSIVISGLEAGVTHTFQVQARWLQADPDQVPLSNEVSGTIAATVVNTPTEPNPTDPNPDAVEPPSSTGSTVKVFPGAVGFGTETVAGRGGQIIKVTNLNDSGSGSLRAAIDASGPRTIVFEVGGAINLNSDLRLSNGYCTIAGQTAPFPGIMLKGYGVRITASNILIQHIAIRVGDDGRTANGSWDNADALQIIGNGSNNIVVDHCSLSWGIDENASIWASNAHDITFSNNIIAEGLMDSVHTEQPHSKGLLVGGASNNPKYVAIIGNLLAHNLDRNPQLKGGTTTVVANNLIYNYGGLPYTGYGANMTRNYVSERILASFVGNVYVDGQDTPSSSYAIASNSTLTSDSKIYAYDNVNYSRPSYMLNSSAKSFEVSSPPVSISDFLPLSSNTVIDSVLSYTGARPAERDDADARIVNEVITGKGSRKNHSSGLWPSYPSVSRDFDQFIPANPNGDDDGDGYTNIEEVLSAMARQVEGR